jgi:Bacterial TSP3 repeat
MTRYHLVTLLAASLSLPTSAQTLIWADNFDTGQGQLALDSAPLAGRRSGVEAENIMVRSSQIQQVSIGNSLYMWGSGGRVRFQRDTTTWCNFAALASAPTILAGGGLTVEFDINTRFGTLEGAYVGFAVGFGGSGEPSERITDPAADYAVRLGKEGIHRRYKNGIETGTPSPAGTVSTGRVKIEYVFNSFADGSPVTVKTSLAGQEIAYDTFTWNGNAGQLYMELENRGGSDQYLDNLKISTSVLHDFSTTGYAFSTGSIVGTEIGNFFPTTLQDEGGLEEMTYTLVTGEGSTDNSKFAINSFGQLVSGSYNFKLGAAGTTYSVRVKGTGTTSGFFSERIFLIKPIKDDDTDLLPDDWELGFPGHSDLTELTGLIDGPGPGAGTGDYDGDGISDFQEYSNWTIEPGLSPFVLDSDGDGLLDSEETAPPAGRPITNPRLADSDNDVISDNDEFTLGSDPNLADTDGDGSRDGFEVSRNSDPLAYSSRPALPAGFAVVPVTDDASTGISSTKTYTHRVSGGAVATVNGVAFDALTAGAAPANFTWTAPTKNQFTTANLGTWVAATGGVTGTGLQELLGTFTYGSQIQSFQLNNLTPGQTYQVKIFIRAFSQASLRPINFTYTNGSDVKLPFGALIADRPKIMLSNDIDTTVVNNDSAYYVSYTYVAQGTSLNIEAAATTADTFHFYGLTNEVVTPANGDPYTAYTSVIPNEADKDKSADPDDDGFTNLQEYLLGGSPIASTPTLTTFEKTGNGIIVRWMELDSGVYVLQESSTLAEPWGASVVVPTVSTDQTGKYSDDYTRKEALIPIDSSKKFIRVKATTAE